MTTSQPAPKRKRAKVARENLQPGVYVVQAGDNGPIKVGRSANPEERVGGIQTGNPAKIVLVAFFVCSTWLIAKTLDASDNYEDRTAKPAKRARLVQPFLPPS